MSGGQQDKVALAIAKVIYAIGETPSKNIIMEVLAKTTEWYYWVETGFDSGAVGRVKIPNFNEMHTLILGDLEKLKQGYTVEEDTATMTMKQIRKQGYIVEEDTVTMTMKQIRKHG